MIKIIFEAHGTTFDNEDGLASGLFDVDLSPLGERQARELGERYGGEKPAVVFCSDLKRSYHTAELAFGDSVPIITDERLRECDYGDFTRRREEQQKAEKANRVSTPFPNGESYNQTTERMKSFLDDLAKNYDGKTVMIIGHRATQYALENLINHVPLKEAATAPWHWQPGWVYELKNSQ
ncbi:histidine phosphatase family protein [Patescibacteria group bacterium]|nr:histidine phosphatase family protein [Patescibacteria group bacterium]